MIGSFRKSFETEEGQAIVIGALMMLILAFGLMVTLNIGTAVQEKIRLQNNSDAAAYSLAVTEAQAFNYISFTNRVQAAHYNMMMTVQTYQTNMLIFESVLGTIYDLLAFINTIAQWIPGIGQGVRAIVAIVGGVLMGLRWYYYGSVNGQPKDYGAIPFMGYVKYFIWYLNYYGHYGSDMIVGGAVWLKILQNMNDIKQANDPRGNDGQSTIYKILNIALNGWEYLSTFDKYAGGIPPVPAYFFKKAIGSKYKQTHRKTKDKNASNNREDTNPYKRDLEARERQKIMGEIANASRSDKFNMDRYEHKSIGIPGISVSYEKIGMSKLISVSPRILHNTSSVRRKSFYNAMSLKGEGHADEFRQGMIKEFSLKQEARSVGPWGDVLATDKGFKLSLEIGLGSLPIIGKALSFEKHVSFGTYVWSDNNGGNYWRWAAPDTNPTGICFDFSKRRNVNCMKHQKSNLATPPTFYFRVPFRVWDFLPGFLKTAIQTLRKICFSLHENPNVRDYNTYDFGPDDGGIGVRSKCKSRCKIAGKCIAPFIIRFANFLESIFRMRFPNHETVSHLTNANQYFFGVAPYVKFLPKDDRRVDYNQPSTWMIMNLSPDKYMQGKHWNFSHNKDIMGTRGSDGGRNVLSTDPVMEDGNKFSQFKMFGIFDPGINVISRARVYYHRPGDWNEHPNFFNPYWRAQLAPIAPKLGALISRGLNIDPDTQNNAPGGGILSQLNNFKASLGNMFANILSKIITH